MLTPHPHPGPAPATKSPLAATVVLYGRAISDPIALLGRVEGVWGIAAALVGLILATLTTNLAANVVAPANAAVAAAPGRFTFIGGAVLTSVVGALVKPWRLIETTSAFYSWLVRLRLAGLRCQRGRDAVMGERKAAPPPPTSMWPHLALHRLDTLSCSGPLPASS